MGGRHKRSLPKSAREVSHSTENTAGFLPASHGQMSKLSEEQCRADDLMRSDGLDLRSC